MYELWNGQHVFILSNTGVSSSDLAFAKELQRGGDLASERKFVHYTSIIVTALFVAAFGCVIIAASSFGHQGNGFQFGTLGAVLTLMISLFIMMLRGQYKRYIQRMEAFVASGVYGRNFHVIDDSRPFWRGIIDSAPEWDATADEMRHRTALGSELTGMVCREWLRCPETFEAAPIDSLRHAELLERGKHFGLRMYSKHMLHHKSLTQAPS